MSRLHTGTGTPRVALATGSAENSRQGWNPLAIFVEAGNRRKTPPRRGAGACAFSNPD